MQLNSDDQQLFDQLLIFNQEIIQRLPLWNQGMGGNISVKLSEGLMAIKPTGLRLDGLKQLSDFAFINCEEFDSFLHHLTMSPKGLAEKEYTYNQEIEKVKMKKWSERRASMEAGFHAALPARFVLHFHHLNSIVLAEILPEIQKSEFFAKWHSYFRLAPYKRPGWELSEYFVKGQVQNKLIVMRNHGAILQLDDEEEWAEFLQFDLELSQFLEAQAKKTDWDQGQEIISALQTTQAKSVGSVRAGREKNSETSQPPRSRPLAGPFKYYYPDVAIFEAKLKKSLKLISENIFSLASDQSISQDLFENWQGMLYLNCLCPNMPGLTLADAESLRAMPSELARVEQMLELAKAALAAAKPGRR